MSVLSDDTDVLLLIPPDFFLIQSDSDEEATVSKKASESLLVSDLITQVNDLEGRICMIESQCKDDMSSPGSLRHLRQFGSEDTLNVHHKNYTNSRSLQVTPLKNFLNLSPSLSWRTSDNSSTISNDRKVCYPRQNILTSSEYVNQKEKDERLLKEIDNFFKTKKNTNDEDKNSTYDRGKPGSLTMPEGTNLITNFNLNKVNDMLKKLDETQKEIEEKLKLKELNELEAEDVLTYEYFEKETEAVILKDVDEPSQDGISESISDNSNKNPRRALKFDESPKKEQNHRKITNSEFHCGEESSANTCTSKGKNENLKDVPSKEVNNLTSLSNLWGSNTNMYKTTLYEDQQILKQRLQEERCRRQHCEELIQRLQLRLLEEQQKIAVAVKVDQEKDQAISKLTDGWNKLVGHWRDLESQRNNLAKKLLTDREKFKNEMSVACQTVKRYEAELSKALDLAHGYKEKCESADKEKKTFKANLTKEGEALRNELREALEKLQTEEEKSKKLEKELSGKEETWNQSRAKISELQSHLKELKKNLKDTQTELEVAKHEKDKLMEKLKEEKSKVAGLEQKKKSLEHQNEELKKKEKVLKDDVKSLTEQMEKTKVELKEFYQEQVENIVQEKLKEFQEQLATAEKTLQKEIEMREKAVTEMAVKQVQQIVEKHVVEINLLEEKHKEEIELWKIQVAQCEEKMRDLQRKLEQYSSHKTEIAQKLHSVMETQWQEALKIITSSSPQNCNKSPLNSARSNPEAVLARQNTFTMTSSGKGEGNLNKNGRNDSLSSSPTTTTDTPFYKEGQVTCREQVKESNSGRLTYRIDETPQKMPPDQDNLKKYIKVLLERAPGHPTDESDAKVMNISATTDESAIPHWQQILSEASSQTVNDSHRYGEYSKSTKENKPPWK